MVILFIFLNKSMLLDDDTSIARNFQKQFKEKSKPNLTSSSVIKQYYRNMLARVKTRSYKKKGIIVEISYDDFEKFWMNNIKRIQEIQDAGYVVSVDRIDSFKNYSLDNIRFLPLHLNVSLGKVEMLQNELKRLYLILNDGKKWFIEE